MLDLIKTNQINEQGKEIKEDELINYDEWLETQASNLITKKLRSFEKREEKINYLNQITNNQFQIENKRVKENEFNLLDIDFDSLTTTTLHERGIYKKIKQELETCDEAFIISPFINIDLTFFKMAIRDNKQLKKVTIITTTISNEKPNINIGLLKQIRALDPERINILIENVEINSKRLHSKVYYFKRENKLSSLYIGSANLSRTGTVNGNEFSVKLSEFNQEYQFHEFKKYLKRLMEQENIISLDDNESIGRIESVVNAIKANEFQKEKLIKEHNESVADEEKTDAGLKRIEKLFPSEFKLFNYQSEAIKNLDHRYKTAHKKHLVVMATGTGKTIVALEYVNKISNRIMNDKPRVLFIAHREEILSQTVLKFMDHCNYEENDIAKYYAGNKVDESTLKDKKLIVGSVQTLINRLDLLEQLKFDLIIFDEVHHVDEQAKTFFKLFNTASTISNEVLGLTATPTRTNGVNVLNYFDGDYAFSLPLYRALQNDNLAPFDYFLMYSDELIDFDVDRDEKALTKFMSNEKKINLIYKIISEDIGLNTPDTSCLIFCPSIENALYVKNELLKRNVKVDALVSSDETSSDRASIINSFRKKVINYLCVVNIFNEGVDIPEINNIIFMRPTTSQLVFVQQLGRGLRRFGDKRLRVFDIVNNINILKNKKYNPLRYLSSIAKIEGHVDDIIRQPKIIDQLIPDSCNFYINQEDSKKISDKLKEIQRETANNVKNILQDYKNDKSYDAYCKMINDNFKDPTYMYNKKLAFLDHNESWNISGLFLFSLMNIREVVIEMKKIIETKNPSSNFRINNIFIRCFWNAANKVKYQTEQEVFQDMFADKNDLFWKEVKYLLDFKLEHTYLFDNKISDEISSFKNIKLTYQLTDAFLKNSPMNTAGQSSVFYFDNEEKHLAVITSQVRQGLEFDKNGLGYTNYIDWEKNALYWSTPRSWTTKSGGSRKSGIESIDVTKYLFFESDKDERWDKPVYTFIGTSVVSEQIILDENDRIAYNLLLK